MFELFDTVMNLLVFAFIGLMVWLYFKEPHADANTEDDGSRHDR